jgi:hypothetical protein
MIIGIQGSKKFTDYSVFLRAMGTALYSMKEDDDMFTIMSAGPSRLNSMGLEFSNVSERSLKARGIKIKFVKVPAEWFVKNMQEVDYFMYFSLPKEPTSPLVSRAEYNDIEVGVYRYA